MPIHDWTRVDAGVFHDFHLCWIASIRRVLNGGVLPPDYYAMAEQHAGKSIPDVLTLRSVGPGGLPEAPEPTGGAAVSAPARTRFHERTTVPHARRTRSVAVRHVTGDRVVAMVEIVSRIPREQVEPARPPAVR